MNDTLTIQCVSPYIEKISEPLKRAKLQKGISNEKISKITGLPYSFLTRIFVGQVVNPPLEHVAVLCKFFNLSLDELTGLTDGAETADGADPAIRLRTLELENARLAGENTRLESFNNQLLQIVGGARG